MCANRNPVCRMNRTTAHSYFDAMGKQEVFAVLAVSTSCLGECGKVQRLKGSEVQRFRGSKVQRFKG